MNWEYYELFEGLVQWSFTNTFARFMGNHWSCSVNKYVTTTVYGALRNNFVVFYQMMNDYTSFPFVHTTLYVGRVYMSNYRITSE